MDDPSDPQFVDRALARLPAVSPSAAFEAALLAGYDGWRAQRHAGLLASLAGAARGFAQMVWPGAPLWAPAAALSLALLLGAGLGSILPGLDGGAMGFSLDRTPGFTALLSADGEEDL